MDREAMLARDEVIVARHRQGATLRVIAEETGISRERVRQVLAHHGLDGGTALATRQKERAVARAALARRASRLLHRHGPMSAREAAERLACTEKQLREVVPASDLPLLVRSNRTRPLHSDRQVADQLRAAAAARAAELGVAGPVPLPASFWEAHRETSTTLSATRLRARYGTWSAACARAGLPVHAVRAPGGADWDDDDLSWWLAVYLEKAAKGAVPGGATAVDYDTWARTDPRVPGAAAQLERFGTWDGAVRAAGAQGL